MLTEGGTAAGMPLKRPRALPTTASTATTPTAAGTPAATTAPEKRGWFGRDRRAGAGVGPAAAGVGSGTAAGAYAGARSCSEERLLCRCVCGFKLEQGGMCFPR